MPAVSRLNECEVLDRLRTIRDHLAQVDALLDERGALFERARRLGIHPSVTSEASGETIDNIRQTIHRRQKGKRGKT